MFQQHHFVNFPLYFLIKWHCIVWWNQRLHCISFVSKSDSLDSFISFFTSEINGCHGVYMFTWVKAWIFRWSFRRKHLPQLVHLNGFTPAWMNICLFLDRRHANLLWQTGQMVLSTLLKSNCAKRSSERRKGPYIRETDKQHIIKIERMGTAKQLKSLYANKVYSYRVFWAVRHICNCH